MSFARPGRAFFYAGQSGELAALKAEAPFLREAPHHCLLQALRDLDRAFANWYEDLGKLKRGLIAPRDVRRPTWRRRDRSDSFRFPDPAQITLDAKGCRLILPKMGRKGARLPALAIRLHRPVRGKIRSVTVSRDGGCWMVSILTQRDVAEPAVPAGEAVGVDLGVNRPAALSDGSDAIVLPARLADRQRRRDRSARLAERRRRLARALARRRRRGKPASSNYRKARAALAGFDAKQARRRRDLLHKASHGLAKNHRLIVVEDLAVAAMTASARGDAAEPGRNVRQKAGLNRSILAIGWGEFRRQLAYKADWYGSRLIAVPAARTSQICAACLHCEPGNRSGSLFACIACGHEADADANAARNILARGLAMEAADPQSISELTAGGHSVAACGELCAGNSLKQEATAARPKKPASVTPGGPRPPGARAAA